MPSIMNLFKNYVINSEDDIPTEYRAEIEEKLSNEPEKLQLVASEQTAGKRGLVVPSTKDIEKEFSDESVCYFGHGTPGDETVLTSILETGLRTVNPEATRGYSSTLRGLDSTTVGFGSGNDQLFEEEKRKLDNWPHKGSQNIVIVSLPKDYILSIMNIGTFADPYKPFYIGSKEQGFSLRPEFIKGIYNAETQSFTENANFYQNLNEEIQKKLFEDIRKSYIQAYVEVSNVNPREANEPLPLNEQEMEVICMEWYKEQLKKLRADRTFDEQDLDDGLLDMTDDMTKSDFEDATHFVKDSARDDRTDELYKDDDEWEVCSDDLV